MFLKIYYERLKINVLSEQSIVFIILTTRNRRQSFENHTVCAPQAVSRKKKKKKIPEMFPKIITHKSLFSER